MPLREGPSRVTLIAMDDPNKKYVLPPHGRMRIGHRLRRDSAAVDGASGTSKQALGFEDATISIELTLPTSYDIAGKLERDALELVKNLRDLFRGKDKQARPKAYVIQSPLTDAWGIKTVLFDSVEVEENETDTILARIEFVEYQPAEPKRRAGKSEGAKSRGEETAEGEEAKSPKEEHEQKSKWRKAFEQGREDAGQDAPDFELPEPDMEE